jgi:hypothetical protein
VTGSTLPADAATRPGRCGAPVHHGSRTATVVDVKVAIGNTRGDAGPMCAECLADFAVGADGTLSVWVLDLYGEWRPVAASPIGRDTWPGPPRRRPKRRS